VRDASALKCDKNFPKYKSNLKLKKEGTNNQPDSTEGQNCQKRKFE